MFMEEIIISLLKKYGATGEIKLSKPPKPELGDFAFSCFSLARAKGDNPSEFASALAEKMNKLKPQSIEKIISAGPYVNIFIKTEAVAKEIVQEVLKKKDKYGHDQSGKGQKVLLEYPSNNTHKEIHVGHLRNICIGNSLVNLYQARGYAPIPVNYINDFGAHVAVCLWGIQQFHPNERSTTDTQKWLGQVYAEASYYLKNHPEKKEEVALLQKKLEAKDKSIWPLYQKTRQWSLKKFEAVYRELGVRHKKVFYEKDIKPLGQKVVDDLLESGNAKIGDKGAIIVDMTADGLDIGLLRKSDGTGLYLTSDLGLALVKNKFFPNIKESIHITGTEQNFYFRQLFKILDLAGYKFKMTHVGYGLVNLPSGKMSSRAGTVILYEDVYNEVFEKTVAETSTRHIDWPKEKIKITARALAFAAIKFDFLKHESAKVIIFDPKTATSFDGFTGPYVLYTIARILSIIKKSGKNKQIHKANLDKLTEPEEKNIILRIKEFSDHVAKALNNYNPSVVAKYSFDLAKLYNDFYGKHSVINASSKEIILARVALSKAVLIVLKNALNLLSIESIEEM